MIATEKMTILQFRIAEELYCIDLANVERVINFVELQSMPGAPPYLKGLLNLAGIEVPVLDVGERLGLKSQIIYSLQTPIIICKVNNNFLGMIVENIIGIESVAQKTLQMSELLAQNSNNLLLGTLSTDQGESLLLNLTQFFNLKISQ